jgi:hypothetical protein
MAIGPIGGPPRIPPDNVSSLKQPTEKTQIQPDDKVCLSKEAKNFKIEKNFWDDKGKKDWNLVINREKDIKYTEINKENYVSDPNTTPLYEKASIKNNLDGYHMYSSNYKNPTLKLQKLHLCSHYLQKFSRKLQKLITKRGTP